MKFHTAFNPQSDPGIDFNLPSMTEQHFKDECDINNIVARYAQTGVLPSGDRQPLYGDFSSLPVDLASSMALYDEAEERFMSLPAEVRKEFDNNPLSLLAFLQDEKNFDRGVELGFFAPRQDAKVVSSEGTVVAENPTESPES